MKTNNVVDNYIPEIIGKQKFIANFFENLLMDVFEDVRIMGGAPRDWDGNTVAKDIDIFVYSKKISDKICW